MKKYNIVKRAYRVRRNNQEIYKGYGFKHLSDATNYYVHPNNQSVNLTTTLAQSIGEAINLVSELYASLGLVDYEQRVNIYVVNKNQRVVNGYFKIQPTHYLAKIFPLEASRVEFECRYNDSQITVNLLDHNNHEIEMDEYLINLISNIALFVAYRESEGTSVSSLESSEEMYVIKKDILQLDQRPDANLFVRVHETYYQLHKNNQFLVQFNRQLDFENYQVNIGESTLKKDDSTKQEIQRQAQDIQTFEGFDERHIPVLEEGYTKNPNFSSIGNAIVAGDTISILLYGAAGTGKTIACKQLCEQMRLPILATINCTENLDEFVLGKYIPVEDKIIFRESEVSMAIRNGGAVVFEEINFARPGYLAFLNSLLDVNGFVRLDNGEIIRRHPDFRFFATMNYGYYGTKEINEALLNRFHMMIELQALSDDSIRHLLKTQVPECIDNIDLMLDTYHFIQKVMESRGLKHVISPRNLLNWAKLAKHCGYTLAGELTLAGVVQNDSLAKQMITSYLNSQYWSYE